MEIKKIFGDRHNYNKKPIPVTQLNMNDENMAFFNEQVKRCEGYFKIIRTPSNYISKKTRFPAYDVRSTNSCVELTVLDSSGFFRIQFRNSGIKGKQSVYGRKAFLIFKDICKKHNICLDDYIIDNGSEVKKEIEEYIIKIENNVFLNRTFMNAHHIDFHSSFPSGLALTHPEFRPVIEELYNGRKEKPEYKLVLNCTIGYMQSEPCCKAKWAQLARDAINNNNSRIRDVAERLKRTGRAILAYNTDGIWYIGDVFHDIDEGTTIGTWANDHTNCKIRFKSKGSYEFEENGKYYPVVRGHTKLDEIKSRDNWQWGDIYAEDAEPIKYELFGEYIRNVEE